MNVRIILSVLLVGIGQVSCAMEASDKASASSTVRRVERTDLLNRAIQNLPEDKEARNKVIRLVMNILNESFESDPRPMLNKHRDNKYGAAFPLHPEILVDIMDYSQGKTVLELAGARGDNALLLGLAGAQKVYINDIDETEVAACRARLDSLPEDIKDRFTMVPGDCFEVFESDKYSEKFDVIYARNILHFFFGEKREQFIKTVARLLKPDGRLIITTNCILGEGFDPHAYVFNRRSYNWRTTEGAFTLYGNTPVAETDPKKVDPLNYRFVPLLVFTPRGFDQCDGFESLSEKDKEKVVEYAKNIFYENIHSIYELVGTRIDRHENQTIAYNKTSLADAFSGTDLTMVEHLLTDMTGHVTDKEINIQLTGIFEKKLPTA